MSECEVCGNDYELAFEVITAGERHTFDCFECAAHRLAPRCEQCGVQILGHGVAGEGAIYCCAHCAQRAGVHGIIDNTAHARPT